MSDQPAPSNSAHQSVIVGLVLGAIGIITSSDVTHLLPTKWALILGGLGSILAGFGITKQIQQNTATTVATGNAVVKAITNAPVQLDSNPAIAAAQRRAMAERIPGSPMQGS